MGARAARWSLGAGLFAWSLCRIVEHDAPWYLAAGDLILRTGALPARDPFSFTSTIPWLDHEWLAQVLLALSYRAGGWPALAVVQALGVAGPIALLCRRRDALAGAAPLVWIACAFVLRETAAPRASLFSLVLFAATLALVLDDEDDARLGGRLWACAPLQLLWTQLHGGNPLGVALLGLRWLTGPTRRRAAVTMACALLTMAGPYGWRVHAHFLSAHGALPMIREWQPLWASLRAGLVAPWIAIDLALLAISLFARPRDARARFALVGALVFTAAGLRWARFSTEAALLAAACAAPVVGTRTARLRPRLVVPAAVALAALLSLGSARTAGLGLEPARFPLGAVAWLRVHAPPGPMFNSYNFGGYLLWARPEEKVFVDGRAFTVYDAALLEEIPRLYADPSRWPALEGRYGLRLAVLQRAGRGAGLNAWLVAHGWRVLYQDEGAQVLARP